MLRPEVRRQRYMLDLVAQKPHLGNGARRLGQLGPFGGGAVGGAHPSSLPQRVVRREVAGRGGRRTARVVSDRGDHAVSYLGLRVVGPSAAEAVTLSLERGAPHDL